MTSRRGVALMLVLWVLVLVAAIAAGVTTASRRAVDALDAGRAALAARHAAESGIAATINDIELSLRRADGRPAARQSMLNALGTREAPVTALGSQRFQVAVVDVSARLDVNAASEAALVRLFAAAGGPARAQATARAITAWTRREAADARPLTALEELRRVPGVDSATLGGALPYLTVDGDGRINRLTAPAIVRASGGGELQDEPSRLLLIARGWQDGHPLTHELQVVVAVQGDLLAVVRQREVRR